MMVHEESATELTTVGGSSNADPTMVMKAAEAEFMGSEQSDVPPVQTSSDLFDGLLGDYELNEIPSLFNMDPQQMASELDSFDYANSLAQQQQHQQQELQQQPPQQELPVGTTNAKPMAPSPPLPSAHLALKPRLPNVTSHKRAVSATISEDEASGPCHKSRRLVGSSGSSVSSASSQESSSSTRATGTSGQQSSKAPIAPKPSGLPTTVSTTSNPIPAYTNADDLLDGLLPVNTSTEHVKALTGAKGAAMCFDIINALGGKTAEETKAMELSAADTENMTPEEKAKFSRDRNRMHARNTRIRKKAYVDELKRTLNALVNERDMVKQRQSREDLVEQEQRDVRFSVMEEFLRLANRQERDVSRWRAILEPNVTLKVPCNPVKEEDDEDETTSGLEHVMNAGCDHKRTLGGSLVEVQCDQESLLMDGTSAVMDWTATALDSTNKEQKIRGTCRARFNPVTNKMYSLNLFFDKSPLLKGA